MYIISLSHKVVTAYYYYLCLLFFPTLVLIIRMTILEVSRDAVPRSFTRISSIPTSTVTGTLPSTSSQKLGKPTS